MKTMGQAGNVRPAGDIRMSANRVFAFALREIRAERRKPGVLLLRVAAVGIHTTIFFGISIWLNPAYFPFIIPGLIFSSLQTLAMMLPVEQARRETDLGTLDAVLASPARPVEWLIGSSLPRLGGAAADAVIYICLGWLLLHFSHNTPAVQPANAAANIAISAAGWVMAGSCLLAIGCVSAAAFMVFRRADAINFALAPVMELSGGVYFSSGMLPQSVRFIAELFPITHALRLARGAGGCGGAWKEILALAALNIAYWSIALYCLRAALRHRRRVGAAVS